MHDHAVFQIKILHIFNRDNSKTGPYLISYCYFRTKYEYIVIQRRQIFDVFTFSATMLLSDQYIIFALFFSVLWSEGRKKRFSSRIRTVSKSQSLSCIENQVIRIWKLWNFLYVFHFTVFVCIPRMWKLRNFCWRNPRVSVIFSNSLLYLHYSTVSAINPV